jgi:hypothetical protein
MTLAALSPDRARCIANPAKVVAAESALLAVLHDRPRLTTAEIAAALGDDSSIGAQVEDLSDGRPRRDRESWPWPMAYRGARAGARARAHRARSGARAWRTVAMGQPLSCYDRRETTVGRGLAIWVEPS